MAKTNEERLAQYGHLDLEGTLRQALHQLAQDAWRPPEGPGRFKMAHRSEYDSSTLERAITELMVRRSQNSAMRALLESFATAQASWLDTSLTPARCKLCHHFMYYEGEIPNYQTLKIEHYEGCPIGQASAFLASLEG